MIEIPGAEATLRRIEVQCDLASFEDHPVLLAEHRQQHPAFEIGAKRMPVDVEIAGERGFLTPFQDIAPPDVISAVRHMVRDEIDDQAHAVRL